MVEMTMPDLSLYDSCGQFTPLSDSDLATLTETQRRAYEDVAAASAACTAVEAQHDAAVKSLHATVKELRATQEQIRLAPKVTFHDLWKTTRSQNL
jgi:hypothetical protein